MIARLVAFGRFWWDFVVGDDPLVAGGVAVALAGTGLLNADGVAGWWLLPAAVVAVLAGSLWRVHRRVHRRSRRTPDPGAALAADAVAAPPGAAGGGTP
jgi:hypothetical protein